MKYIQNEQESIPVGCVPPALVVTARCQHQGVYLPSEGCHPLQKGPRTRHTPPPDRLTDRHL